MNSIPAFPIHDHGLPIAVAQRLLPQIHEALEQRRHDAALVLIDRLRAQLDALLAAAWVGKRAAL